jgi:hypothetical protein
MHPMADYAAKELKLKRIVTISENFAFGYEQMGGFQQTFEDEGGKIYVRRCERSEGKLINKTVKTYKDVSQFWTYDEKKFLSQPVYSRDFPPLKS